MGITNKRNLENVTLKRNLGNVGRKSEAPSGNEGKAHAHMDVGSRAMQEHIAERLPAIPHTIKMPR